MKLAQALAVYGVRPETIREAFVSRWGDDGAPTPIPASTEQEREREHAFLARTSLVDERQWLISRLESAIHPLTRGGQAEAATRLLSLNATLDLPYATDNGQRITWSDYERWRQLADEYRRREYAERYRPVLDATHRHLRERRMLWIRTEITRTAPTWAPLT